MSDVAAPLATEDVDVAIVGGGPAGLAAGQALAQAGAGRVVVLDRESATGGIPRHAHHPGYGIRDLHRMLSGPEYAQRRSDAAAAAGVELRTGTDVTGWAPGGELRLLVTSPSGRAILRARAVVLATGCRERPRSARLVAGSRPQGVLTTGMLQQLVYLLDEPVGRRAVVVGAEHVSYSALQTLAHGGARTIAMTTPLPRHQSYGAFRLGAALRFGTPLLTETDVTLIRGRRRVEGVELTDRLTGARRELTCDTVVFTGGWIPDHELAVQGGAVLDRATRGPAVDPGLRTTRPGVFAVGNLIHGAETADVAALTGAHVVSGVSAWLAGAPWPADPVAVSCEAPLDWITPNLVDPGRTGAPVRGRFLVRAQAELIDARLAVSQSGRALWTGRLPRVMSGRSAALPADWAASVDPRGGPVSVRVLRARPRPRRAPRPASGC